MWVRIPLPPEKPLTPLNGHSVQYPLFFYRSPFILIWAKTLTKTNIGVNKQDQQTNGLFYLPAKGCGPWQKVGDNNHPAGQGGVIVMDLRPGG